MNYDFSKINFGMADAQAEGQQYPLLLTNGYFDKDKIVNLVFNSTPFLFLGYKGSGKTALSEHLRLLEQEDTIIDQLQLESFPYKTFSKIVSGGDETEVKVKAAWKWLLLVKVLGSLIQDKDAHSQNEEEVKKAIDIFTQVGIFPLTDISSLVKRSSSKSFKAGLKSISYQQTTQSENASISFEMALDYITKLVMSFKEEKRHLIVIDGLDDILTSGELQYKSIAGLLNVVKNMNVMFSQNDLLVKIIILCRTDIFERLPDPNKNKIRADFSYTFNWYVEGADDQTHCGLIDIANIRTQLVFPEIHDMFTTFFPHSYEGKNTAQYLLEMTRHTPRDFLRLLHFIQCHSDDTVTSDSIKKGISQYSSEYFIPEIIDEMTGYVPYDRCSGIIQFLASFRKRQITSKEMLEELDKRQDLLNNGLNADDILNILYECSAIGNVYSYDGSNRRISFKYRNRFSSFDRRNDIILHRGFWKGLNVNF